MPGPKDQKPEEPNKFPKKSTVVEVVQIFKGYQLDKDGNRTQKTHTCEASSELEAELLLEAYFIKVNKEKKSGRK